jgi:hypothetical protein
MDDPIFLAAKTPKLVYRNAKNCDSLFAWIPVTGERTKREFLLLDRNEFDFPGKEVIYLRAGV